MDAGSLIVGFLAGVIASAAFAAALDTFVPAFGLLRGRDRSLGRPGPSQSDIAAEQTASIIAYWRGQTSQQQETWEPHELPGPEPLVKPIDFDINALFRERAEAARQAPSNVVSKED